MHLLFVFILVTTVNLTTSVKLSVSLDEGSVIITCETTNFDDVISFEKDGSPKGGCFSGLTGSCTTGISGYANPIRQGTTITKLEIESCNVERDTGSWECKYGFATSNIVHLLTCSIAIEHEDLKTLLSSGSLVVVIKVLVVIYKYKKLPKKLQTYDLYIHTNDTEDDVHWRGVYIIMSNKSTQTRRIFLEEDERFMFKHDSRLQFKLKDIDLDVVSKIEIGYDGPRHGRLCYLEKIDIFKRKTLKHYVFKLDCWVTTEQHTVGTIEDNDTVVKDSIIVKEADYTQDLYSKYRKVKWVITKVVMVDLILIVIGQLLILFLMFHYVSEYRLEVVLPIAILVITCLPFVVQIIIMYQIYKRCYIQKCYFVNHHDIKSTKEMAATSSRK